MKRYNPKEIEPKWQQKWEADGTYVVDFNSSKPKYVAFGMFNYPSGAGIHVGHVRNFTIPDVITRVKRQQGYESYQPVGWDSFGLPAENYAIKTGVAPQVSIKQAIEKYHEQYRAMGWAMDWTKEIDTTEPEYYRWTQWCFSKLFENGLAYQQESPQWWCDQCKTVLADEQVTAGKCWRHDNEDDPLITKRNLKQWFFKITDYADEMLDSTDDLNWTQSVKSSQKSWIGRSVGAEINFQVCHPELDSGSNKYARSYIMGQKNISKADIESFGGTVHDTSDAGHLTVSFPISATQQFEDLIVKKMEPGFWNEYLGDETIFIFKDKDGAVTRMAWSKDTESKLLDLCNSYANANFDSISEMLKGNDWYKDWILNQVQDDNGVIKVFTTRPDTLFGATFLVLAPEHPILDSIVTEEQQSAVQKYKEATSRKSEVQRQQDADKKKTGVFTGAYAVNPATKKEIPIWISDYVLMGYGTGAIMAVPAHDERDNDFAKTFDLPIIQVVEPQFGKAQGNEIHKAAIIAIVRDPKTSKVLVLDWGPRQENWGGNLFIGGGIEENEDPVETAVREIAEETGYTNVKHIKTSESYVNNYFFSNVKNKNYHAKFLPMLFELVDQTQSETNLDENEDQFTTYWVNESEIAATITDEAHLYGYTLLTSEQCYHGEGVMINSGEYDGTSSSEAREKIVADLAKQNLASETTNYKMRDWLISRQRYWGAPIPIIHCEDHGAVLVPESDLPVVLPEVENYRPTGGNVSALANAKEWVNAPCPKCGKMGKRETDTMDGYVCSSWYFLRYMDPTNNQKAWDEKQAGKWMPVDCYNGGDHATAHLLYARFFNRFFHKLGLIDSKEPFKKMIFHGKIKAGDGSAFSKSKGNGIDPLEVIEQGYGADSIRLYQMFAAPLELDVLWDQQGIPGAYKYLARVWHITQEHIEAEDLETPNVAANALMKAAHKAIKKVSEDIEGDRFNTAIAALMELTNTLYKTKTESGIQKSESWKFALETLLQLLAPFAPHISEELWQDLGNKDTIHVDHWPVHDEKYLVSDLMKIVVQVNGKVRATIEVAADLEKETILEAAKQNEKVASYITSGIKKEIYVPGRLVNLVV